MEDDIDVYLVRAKAETFERPLNGSSKEWTLAPEKNQATYVKLSQVVSFAPKFQGMLTYVDEERGAMVGVPSGYGLMELLPDDEMKRLRDAFYKARR